MATQTTTQTASEETKGLPLWIPLLGLGAALLFAIFVAARIIPTLAALVLPPDPPLPNVAATQVSHESKGVGLDEWVYATEATGCDVAKYYLTRIGNCSYDPDSGCERPSRAPVGSIQAAQ